jgi:hypothetical protein
MHRLVSYFCSSIGRFVVAFLGRTKKNNPNGVKPEKRTQIKECKLTRDVKGKRKTGSGVFGLVESNEVSRGMTLVAPSNTCMVDSIVVCDIQAYQNVCKLGYYVE